MSWQTGTCPQCGSPLDTTAVHKCGVQPVLTNAIMPLKSDIQRIAELESENARLRKAIEDAPHDEYCSSRGVDEMYPKIPVPCDCWKSKALGEQK